MRARARVSAHHQVKLVVPKNVVGLDCTLQPAANNNYLKPEPRVAIIGRCQLGRLAHLSRDCRLAVKMAG